MEGKPKSVILKPTLCPVCGEKEKSGERRKKKTKTGPSSDPHDHDAFKSHIRKYIFFLLLLQKLGLLFIVLCLLSALVQAAFAIDGCKRMTDVPQLLNRTAQRSRVSRPLCDISEFKRRPLHLGGETSD